MSSTFSHLEKKKKKNRRQRSSRNEGEKNGLCQNRKILHDTCEVSVISINRQFANENLVFPQIRKSTQNIEMTFWSKLDGTI